MITLSEAATNPNDYIIVCNGRIVDISIDDSGFCTMVCTLEGYRFPKFNLSELRNDTLNNLYFKKHGVALAIGAFRRLHTIA